MLNMFLQRCVLIMGMLLGLMVITFLISHVTPGDPAALAAGPDATQEMIDQIRTERGFDKPVIQQFFIYVGGRCDRGSGNVPAYNTRCAG